MLTKLFIENFQSLMFPQNIRLAPLTLIVGANSSGKSSVSRALRLFQQSFEHNDLHFAGERVDLTSFKTAVSQHDTSEVINFGVEMAQAPRPIKSNSHELFLKHQNLIISISETKTVRISGFKGRTEFELRSTRDEESGHPKRGVFSFEASLPRANSKHLELSFSVESGGEYLTQFIQDLQSDGRNIEPIRNDKVAPAYPVGLIMLQGEAAYDVENWNGIPVEMRGLQPRIAIHSTLAGVVPETADGFVLANGLVKIARDVFAHLRERLTGMQSVAPLRSIMSGLSSRPVGRQSLSASGDNIQQFLLAMRGPEFEKLSDRLKKLTRGKYEIRRVELKTEEANIGEISQVVLVDLSNTEPVHVLFQDAGVGISQVLPILVAISRSPLAQGLRFSPAGSRSSAHRLTFIEQPELHLHPEMQADLADVFIDVVKPVNQRDGKLINHSQIVVETHSESMILRIQKRIREGKLDPRDVSIIGVDDFAGGGSLAQEYRISSEGRLIDELPRDFSALRLNELL